MKSLLRVFFLASLAVFSAVSAGQEKYPSRPIMLNLGFSPGGIGDGIVRQIAEFARETRNATIVIDYKPGASSTIATAFIKRSAPDGYTVALMSPTPIQVVPQFQSVPYDSAKDFTYLGQMMSQPMPMYVLADSPHRSMKDVVSFAENNPGKFTWGTAGVNGLAQILMQSAFAHAKVSTTNVPYKGGADAINALLGGHIDAVVSTDFGPLLASGKVRLVVETGQQKAVPTVSTLKELGYPLSITVQYGIFGPAGLPGDAIAWWDAMLRDFAASPKYAEFASRYYGLPTYSSPAKTTADVTRGYIELGQAVQTLGLKTEK